MQPLLDDYTQGAAFATELVNTSPTVWVVAGDQLSDPDALRSFLVENGIDTAVLDEGDLQKVRALRERLRAILDASSPGDIVDLTHELLSTVPHHVELVEVDGNGWRWQATTDGVGTAAQELTVFTGYALLSALRMLGFERFRACASPTCNGVFVDVSRGGRRRYCMPGLCGNRINVANHRQRRNMLGDK
ncbi:CGNR zinc finger domain-containing protein [Rhodococcoides fascians A25f]|uniref:CGNR zinc finger domain-containing protein n=1 Tax=Rhodococcoides fascians TaxID=1828 RepID=UPI00055A44B8|nr:CGNR zinc finger domain-containing protein [Rhodococcus fascians]QII08136.1 CGNR zinc finger domain-containing protein [Rhodococcus fascians A25f]